MRLPRPRAHNRDRKPASQRLRLGARIENKKILRMSRGRFGVGGHWRVGEL